tara:strand:- start:2 stop:343 length:342 start_codon:yes stop_codon:yes gene_type:complete
MRKAEMEEEMERLRAQLEEHGVDDSPSLDPNGYYIPTAIHINIGQGNLCGYSHEGSWEAEWMEDKKAKKLPHCVECVEALKKIRAGIKIPDSKPPLKYTGVFVKDYRSEKICM